MTPLPTLKTVGLVLRPFSKREIGHGRRRKISRIRSK